MHRRSRVVAIPGPVSRPAVEPTIVASAPAPPPPDAARSAQLFERNRGMVSDPDLATEYERLNLDYFKNMLPASTSVRWESGLADLGPLIADNFSVLGLTDGSQILLNPVVERDSDQRRRALCHEMVHMAVWRQDTGHGAVFQDQLRHLSELGAFKGIVSTDEERDAALGVLKHKRTALETDERTLQVDRESLDRTSQSAVDGFNARIAQHQAAIAEYNHLVEQYNLMISYPDGSPGNASRRAPTAPYADAVLPTSSNLRLPPPASTRRRPAAVRRNARLLPLPFVSLRHGYPPTFSPSPARGRSSARGGARRATIASGRELLALLADGGKDDADRAISGGAARRRRVRLFRTLLTGRRPRRARHRPARSRSIRR
jgi:hypothetical protein